MGSVLKVNMPPGRKFQAIWAALHLGASGLAVYVVVSDLRRTTSLMSRVAGISLLGTAALLHLASATYHSQRSF